MSDDEDFYDDEYDEDWVWFEDASPDIADDLAGTAVYSPVLIDDPSFDTEESFSDWEYYSDDYYDEDLSVVRKQAGTQASRDKTGLSIHNERRRPVKKRRKLVPTAEIPELSLGAPAVVKDYQPMRLDPASFQSVVWRRPSHEDLMTELHEPGDGEKVALLKNWREIFKNSQPRHDSVRVTKKLQSNSKSGRPTNRFSRRGRAATRNSEKRDPSRKLSVIISDDHSYNDQEYPEEPKSTTGEPLPPPPESISGSERPASGLRTRTKAPDSGKGSRLKNVMSAQDDMKDETSSASAPEPKIAVEVPLLPTVQPDGLDESLSVGAPPAPPPRRSQRNKRKADASPGEESHDHATATEENARPRKKRVVSMKTNADKEKRQRPTTTLRRSTRARKGRK